MRRRLEACRTALLADRARTVTDVALGWGFSNRSTFYRAFRAAFGMTPGELRAAARDDRRLSGGAAGEAVPRPIAAGPIAAGPIAAGPIAAGTVAAGTVAAGTVAAGTVAAVPKLRHRSGHGRATHR